MTQGTQALGSTVVVDGIEGKWARVELPDGTTEDWALSSLPKGVKEGDVIRLEVTDGDLDLEIDHAETKRRRQGAQARLDALNGAASDGEITL
jgi:DnaJ-class molecular chaperone